MRGESWKFQWRQQCIEAHGSTGQRLESSLPKDHEDHISGKEHNSMTHYNLVHEFLPMPQAMKISDAKAAVDEEWKKLETISARQLEKVKSKKEAILEAQRHKKKVHFATLMDSCHLKECGVRTKITKKFFDHRQSRAPW